MRSLITIAILIAGAIFTHSAAAEFRFGGAHAGAWCLFEDPWTYNCGFATLPQCVETARGLGGQCQLNPSGPPEVSRPRRAPRRNS
jgi:hypothetical protein